MKELMKSLLNRYGLSPTNGANFSIESGPAAINESAVIDPSGLLFVVIPNMDSAKAYILNAVKGKVNPNER